MCDHFFRSIALSAGCNAWIVLAAATMCVCETLASAAFIFLSGEVGTFVRCIRFSSWYIVSFSLLEDVLPTWPTENKTYVWGQIRFSQVKKNNM